MWKKQTQVKSGTHGLLIWSSLIGYFFRVYDKDHTHFSDYKFTPEQYHIKWVNNPCVYMISNENRNIISYQDDEEITRFKQSVLVDGHYGILYYQRSCNKLKFIDTDHTLYDVLDYDSEIELMQDASFFV